MDAIKVNNEGKIRVTMKIYPAIITSQKEKYWIETQGAKKISLKINRKLVDDKTFKNLFEYLLSLGYAAHSRDTFIK